ncbi:UNVERIFIED_CONTAM: methyltransferase family protein [Acetivibrio alkalicellulosi]
MSMISDSSAVLELQRILPQHQSAITLLNNMVQDPCINEIKWLDLACGKGQIISQLKENLSDNNRKKIIYDGYDINVEFTKIASRIASNLELRQYRFNHGDLSNFAVVLGVEKEFDFITCTNVAHELHPNAFVSLVLDSFKRLTSSGQLFIYDMESLTTPELGAFPLRGNEITSLLNTIFECLNTVYRVHASVWSHKTCKGWSIIINRAHISIENEIFDKEKKAITNKIKLKIDDIIQSRCKECVDLLTTYTIYGADTAEDEQLKLVALYEFWALHYARGGK